MTNAKTQQTGYNTWEIRSLRLVEKYLIPVDFLFKFLILYCYEKFAVLDDVESFVLDGTTRRDVLFNLQ